MSGRGGSKKSSEISASVNAVIDQFVYIETAFDVNQKQFLYKQIGQ